MSLKVLLRVGLCVGAMLMLSACGYLFESPNSDNAQRNVKITSNAVFFATRDGVKAWDVAAEGNTGFNPNFVSLLVEDADKQYSVMFVCPSSNSATPHRVYYYLATVGELGEINHLCRKAEATILYSSVFGVVSGIDINSGERARLALGANDGIWAYEAYSFEDVDGRYDILGYVAKVQQDGSLQPVRYHKHGSVRLSNPPVRLDINFQENLANSISASVGTATQANITVSGMPAEGSKGTRISYRSELNSWLTLAEGTGETLPFYGFPIEVMVSDSKIFDELKEGHVATAWLNDAEQRPVQEIVQLFKTAQDADLQFAQASLSGSSATLSEHEAGVSVNTSWSTVSDAVYGDANLYHWVLKGKAANGASCSDCGGKQVAKVEWHVMVTPGWLAASSSSASFSLEPVTNLSSKWYAGWNFSAGLQAFDQWHASAYFASVDKTINSSNTSTGQEALLTYLFNREYVDGLGFAKVVTYSQ